MLFPNWSKLPTSTLIHFNIIKERNHAKLNNEHTLLRLNVHNNKFINIKLFYIEYLKLMIIIDKQQKDTKYTNWSTRDT
jgi:hypothetical protein